MAFNPERLSMLLEPVGGVGMRWFNYKTDEAQATLTGAGFIPNASDYGLRESDLIFVSRLDVAADPYILVVEDIDADGSATMIVGDPLSEDLAVIAGLSKSDGNFIVADGADWTVESGATARDSLGLGTAAVKNTGTSGDAVPLLNIANTWSAAQTFTTESSSTTVIKLESTAADGVGGPQLDLVRNSASPAANDVIGILRVRGMNSAASEITYANINTTILDPTSGSEDSRIILQVPVAGAQTSAVSIANGMLVGAPTGSYQGTGTVNATDYYRNGTALSSTLFGVAVGDASGNLKALNADGGFTLDLATTPTVNMGIVFGGTWKAANKQVVTSTGLLTGTYATQVLRWEGEGHNSSGATESGLPLFLEGKKTNYLTSTTEGQILGTYTTIYGGRKGDHAAHLFGARKVFAGTYDGSVLGIEGSVQKLDASGATTQHVQCYMGWGMYNPGAGLNFAPDGMLGFAVEPRVGETYAAFAAVERSDLSAAFEYVMAASTSRNNANIFYSVTGSGHASGAGIITAQGAPTFLSATATPAGGTTGAGIKMSTTANFGVFFGSGAPTLTAAKGSLYLRRDGTSTNNRAYINTDGGTTWTALTTVA